MEERDKDMCWSWNAKDIDPDEDDGKVWIPVMPKTLEAEAEEDLGSPHMPSGVKEMTVYLVGRGPARDTQARMLVRKVAATLKTTQPMVILANEESLEEGESSEESKAREGKPLAAKQKTRPGNTTRKGTTRTRVGKEPAERWGPKSQPAVMLTMPRLVLCDRC